MNEYEALARELMHSFDTRKKAPPHEEISAAMRGEMAVLQLLPMYKAGWEKTMFAIPRIWVFRMTSLTS